MNKVMNEEVEENVEFNDDFHSKTIAGFQRIKNPQLEKKSTATFSQFRGKTTRPNTRVSASQRQAREYLNYLNALNLNEFSYINSQITQKTNELQGKFELEAKKEEEVLNSRGIFSTKFNKERVASMLPVKMQSQLKLIIEPMVRNSKDIVMKEKIKEWQYNPFNNSKCETADTAKSARKMRLFDIVERTISKKAMKARKKEVAELNPNKQKGKMHWVDRLNQTVNETMIKCKPDERISNMEIL